MRCFLACDSVSKMMSGRNGGQKTILSGLFDIIWATDVPTFYGHLALFIQFSGGSGKHVVTVVATDKNGQEILPQVTTEADLTGNEKFEIYAQIAAIPVKTFGDITFTVKIDGSQIGWPLVIHVNKAEAVQ